MHATHYMEQYRQQDKTRLVTGPLQEIKELPKSLKLTKSSNCKTIAVFKIKFKPGCEPKQEVYERTN